MEAGSFAGAPAETEEQVQQQAAPTESEVQPEPTAPAENGQEGTEDNQVLSAINDLRSRVDALGEQPSEPATDLLSALNEPDEFEEEQAAPEQQLEDPAAQQQVEDLRAFIRNEAQELVSPIQRERRDEQLKGLEAKYPDITSEPVMERLKPLVASLAQRSGNEALIDDPVVVETLYKAVKAEMADAGAVPAEQVANQGASLETNAGQSQAGDPNPTTEDKYRQLVYGSTPNKGILG